MKLPARLLLIIAPTLLLCACAPGVLAAIFGGVAAVAPVAVSALDAYAAQAQRLAPGATPADIDAIVARLAALDRCDTAAHATLAPDAGAGDTQALIDAAAALRGLTDAIEAARKSAASIADAGKEGGGA